MICLIITIRILIRCLNIKVCFYGNCYIKCSSITELPKQDINIYMLYIWLPVQYRFWWLISRSTRYKTNPSESIYSISPLYFAFNKCTTWFIYYWDLCNFYPHTVAVHSACVCSINGLCTKCMSRSHAFVCIACIMVLFIYTSLGQTQKLSQIFMWVMVERIYNPHVLLGVCLAFLLNTMGTMPFSSDHFLYVYPLPRTHIMCNQYTSCLDNHRLIAMHHI